MTVLILHRYIHILEDFVQSYFKRTIHSLALSNNPLCPLFELYWRNVRRSREIAGGIVEEEEKEGRERDELSERREKE